MAEDGIDLALWACLYSQPVLETLLEAGLSLRDVLAYLSVSKGPSINQQSGVTERSRAWFIQVHGCAALCSFDDVEMLERMISHGCKPAKVCTYLDVYSSSSSWQAVLMQAAYVTHMTIEIQHRDMDILNRLLKLTVDLVSLSVTFWVKTQESVCIEQLKLPTNLQRLDFLPRTFRFVPLPTLPNTLTQLSLRGFFNLPLDLVNLPAGLRKLTLGHKFNCSIENFSFPPSLETLTFGHFFNQSLSNVVLPPRLRVLKLGRHFNQPLDCVLLPATLQCLEVGSASVCSPPDTIAVFVGKQSARMKKLSLLK